MLTGAKLLKLQDRCKSIAAVIIDEYSMIPSKDIFYVNQRLKQGFANDMPYGGIPVVWVGDPGQIPPVGGSSGWVRKTSNNIPITGIAKLGHEDYMSITTVMKLTDVVRQRGVYMELLLRLRDGKTTIDDWQLLMDSCTVQNITPEKLLRFHSSETMWLFNTNKENNHHNINQLKLMLKPIILINAEHDSLSSVGKSTESCRKLAPKLHLCIGAKIMLLWNINISLGLVNGSNGIIKDFIFSENIHAPSLPTAIIVYFSDYSGPSYFSGIGQEKWVPIFPETFKWGGSGEIDHFRKQFPICLSWALTVWKSQGMTITGLVALSLGDAEKEHGLTFVALSRATDMCNVFLGAGCSLERLSTKISSGYKLKQRLKEDIRLQLLYENTMTFYEFL
jgi:ATP-dependent DNA helicase PIF1